MTDIDEVVEKLQRMSVVNGRGGIGGISGSLKVTIPPEEAKKVYDLVSQLVGQYGWDAGRGEGDHSLVPLFEERFEEAYRRLTASLSPAPVEDPKWAPRGQFPTGFEASLADFEVATQNFLTGLLYR